MTYGETIRLPGQFLHEQDKRHEDTDDFVGRLKKAMRQLQPWVKHHSQKQTFIFKEMNKATHVFVRHDTPTTSLQQPYDGPYEVLSRGDKTFKLRINGKTVNTSIGRLKPAYTLQKELEESKISPTKEDSKIHQPAEKRTRAGRAIRPPVRFSCK
ncbi:gag-pol protein [Lasius niger]|uniref:Gag-pol protein n=1 Tax=Lasius niger TaxID=67767 RepID=A0A0J7NNP4_LASNI|nr:gag-pol protein [Lasius niger]